MPFIIIISRALPLFSFVIQSDIVSRVVSLLYLSVEDVYSQKAGGLDFMSLRLEHCIGKWV